MLFAKGLYSAVREWNLEQCTRELRVKCEMTDKVVDGSLNFFADDLCRKLLVLGGDALEARRLLHPSAAALAEVLGPERLLQNKAESETISSLRSVAENRKLARTGCFPGTVLTAARHLGGRQTWNATLKAELRYRRQAMLKNWRHLSKYWASSMPRRITRLILLVRIQTIGLSDIEALPISSRECEMIDANMCRWLRMLLKGAAAQFDDAKGHVVRWSNSRVLGECHVCAAEVELVARRTQWLHSMVHETQDHQHVVAVLWRQATLEHAPTLERKSTSGRLYVYLYLYLNKYI